MIRRPPRSTLFPYTRSSDLRGRYDLAILLQNAFEAAAITALAGIPNRYGYATDGRSFLLTHRVPLSPKIRRKHRSEEHTSELQSPCNLVCRLLLEKKKTITS